MKIEILKFRLKLHNCLQIANDSFDFQDTLIVALSHNGYTGYGEATVEPYYNVSYGTLERALEKVRPLLAKHSLEHPEQLWHLIAAEIQSEPFALCALDCAAYDLWGKLRGRRTIDLLGFDTKQLVPSNYTLGIDTIDAMVSNLRSFASWPIFKVKLGTDYDTEIISALRKESSKPFRVDANTGWDADKTLKINSFLLEHGVEFIEQPLPPEDVKGQKHIFAHSQLPIIADESCIVESDVERCADKFHGINIKLMKCGGITPALRMIDKARELGMKVMCGCMAESSVGISAIAQILPRLDYVDMDSVALLSEDIATGVSVLNGVCSYSEDPGSGISLK